MKIITLMVITLLSIALIQAQQFSCPTTSAGCNSYEELLKAKDASITSGLVHYVCFQDSIDEFFVIEYVDPYLSPRRLYKWNSMLTEYELNPDVSIIPGIVIITSFKDGVENDSVMPRAFAYGMWKIANGVLTFNASLLNKSTNFSINMDNNQILFFDKYKSVSGRNVNYTFAIQLSTKRFSEQYKFENDSKNNFDTSGRCIGVSPFPQFPDPPTLTQKQQGEKTKMNYCSQDFAEKNLGYCASSFTYIEDYQAAQKKVKH